MASCSLPIFEVTKQNKKYYGSCQSFSTDNLNGRTKQNLFLAFWDALLTVSIEFRANDPSLFCRFTPTYLFIVLFNATLFFKLGHGPAWPLLAENERTSCRNNWWTNMLYVNNFIRTKEPVSQCELHATMIFFL